MIARTDPVWSSPSRAHEVASLLARLLVELLVHPPRLHELIVGTALDDPALRNDQDDLAVLDRGQTMRDGEGRPAPLRLLQRGGHHLLALAVESAGGLVEQKNGWVLDHGATDRHALLLAARQPLAARPDLRVPALRCVAVQERQVAHLLALLEALFGDFLAVVEPVLDILQHAGVEEDGLLADEAHLPPPPPDVQRIQRRQVRADQYLSRLRIVESLQHGQHCALATARRPHHAHGCARLDREAQRVQHLQLQTQRVREIDTPELNSPYIPHVLDPNCIKTVDEALAVEELEQVVCGNLGLADVASER
mmetsp:Transcript_117831/g.311348  ORF Transcript_117831/g.311348 Transcript_117831/m.311348 type:complete len:309 (-) Transcript_117831:691-1617(-)